MPELHIFDPADEGTGAELSIDLSGSTYLCTRQEYPVPALQVGWASSVDTEGEEPTSRRYENRRVTLVYEVMAASESALVTAVRSIETKVAKLAREGGTFRRTLASGASGTLDVLAADGYDVPFDIAWYVGNVASVTVQLVCRPFWRGALETVGYVSDDFSTDTIASGAWVFGAGSGTLSVSGGQLVPSTTAEKELYRSAWSFTETRATGKATAGASVASGGFGVIAKRLDANNFLLAQLTFAGASSKLEVYKKDAGAFTSLATSALFATAAAASYWVRLRVEGSQAVAELFTSAPAAGAAPAQSVSHTLAGADATKFGSGVSGGAGLRIVPAATDYRYDDFTAEAFFETVDPALIFTVSGVKGDVPALGRLVVDEGQGQAQDAVIWGVESRQLVTTAAVLREAESADNIGSGGLTATADATASGGQKARQTAAASPGASGPAWTFTTLRGTYRALMRASSANTTNQIKLSATPSTGVSTTIKTVTLTGGATWTLYDFGVIKADDRFMQQWDISNAILGSGTVDVDYLLLVPAAEGTGQASKVTNSPVFGGGQFWVRDSFVGRDTSSVKGSPPTGANYRYPDKYEGDYLLVPSAGSENRQVRFVVKAARGGAPSSTAIPDTAIDDVSARLYYVPRYLMLPGS